ncbi:hypothetical protein COLO4_02719 [Corchorus olitorius]|uniref:Uncharacterized protein n=1 Tax=Corchorus olitorius TaxID=93759 RepID=A0A1R3L0G8_9ROSI|nr:hypothetical protein COLO4_02719 [Corchorus olitorius]
MPQEPSNKLTRTKNQSFFDLGFRPSDGAIFSETKGREKRERGR